MVLLGIVLGQVKPVPAQPDLFRQFYGEESETNDFQIGWYDIMNRPQSLPKIAQGGFDSVMPYGGSSEQMIDTYLDAAQKANVKVLFAVNPSLKQIEAGDIVSLQQKIRRYKNNQQIYAWYIADEPAFNKVPPQYLETVYRVVKAEDPTRPVAIAFNSNPHLINKYRQAFDILMYDKYPCKTGTEEFETSKGVNLDFTRKRFQQLGDYAQANNKQYIPIIQAFGQPKDPMKIRRFCTQGESRYLIYTSILAQADSLFFWAHFASNPTWINSVLTPLVNELKTYLPAIQQQSIVGKVLPDHSEIQARLYQQPNSQNYLLIAVNHGNQLIDTNLRVRPRIRANFNLAQVMTEERRVSFSRQLIRDTFKPYQVHVYQLSASSA